MKSLLVIICCIVISIQSCTVYKSGTALNKPFIDLRYNNMEYVKDIKGSTVQTYFLFFPVGGKRYKRGYPTTDVISLVELSNKRGTRGALYDALLQAPDADFVMPVQQTVKIERMFLGKREYVDLRLKAFRIQNKYPVDTAVTVPVPDSTSIITE